MFVDTFSEWVEAFPTKQEMASVVVKKILEKIFPRFGVPKVERTTTGSERSMVAVGSSL